MQRQFILEYIYNAPWTFLNKSKYKLQDEYNQTLDCNVTAANITKHYRQQRESWAKYERKGPIFRTAVKHLL